MKIGLRAFQSETSTFGGTLAAALGVILFAAGTPESMFAYELFGALQSILGAFPAVFEDLQEHLRAVNLNLCLGFFLVMS